MPFVLGFSNNGGRAGSFSLSWRGGSIGAVKCVQLEKELVNWFVLRKLLDVPKDWCENTLKGNKGQDQQGPASWFGVCTGCLNSVVGEAWRVHQQILELEGRMKEIKMGITRRIKDNSIGRGGLGGDESIPMKIRALVVPDIYEASSTIKMETELPTNDLESEHPALESDGENDVGSTKDVTEDVTSANTKPKATFKKQKKKNQRRTSKKVKRKRNLKSSKAGKKRGNNPKSKSKGVPVSMEMKSDLDSDALSTQDLESGDDPDDQTWCPTSADNDLDDRKPIMPYLQKKKNPVKQRPRGPDKKPRKCTVRPRKERPPPRILYPCTHCKCTPFTSSTDFQQHLDLHQKRNQEQEEGVTTQENLNCTQCTYPARDSLQLKDHLLSQHSLHSLQNREHRKYLCPLCPMRQRDLSDMLKHIKHKHPDATEELRSYQDSYLKCDLCDFRGNLPKELSGHKRRYHKDLDPPVPNIEGHHLCDFENCGILFSSEKELQSHVFRTHLRVSRYICDICGAGFPYPGELSRHKVVHTKDMIRDWICDVCGVDFPRKRQLARHHLNYHSDPLTGSRPSSEPDDKTFKCRYCDLTSPFNAVIRKHLQTHKKESEHRCDKCGKFYMNSRGLKRHLRINHAEGEGGGGEVVKCLYCQKGFTSKEYMMIHAKRYCKLKNVSSSNQLTQEN